MLNDAMSRTSPINDKWWPVDLGDGLRILKIIIRFTISSLSTSNRDLVSDRD